MELATPLVQPLPIARAAFDRFIQSAPCVSHGWTAVHLDLANFGLINQVVGRRGGDKILRDVERVLQGEAAFTWFHLGGDSWAGFSEKRPVPAALQQLERVRAGIRLEGVRSVGRDVRLDAFFGVASDRHAHMAAQRAEAAYREARRTARRFVRFEDMGFERGRDGFVSRYLLGEPVSRLVQLHRQAILFPGARPSYEVLSRYAGGSMAQELMTLERLGLAVDYDLALIREALIQIPPDASRHTVNLSSITASDSSALVEIIGLLRGRQNIAVEVTETAEVAEIGVMGRAVEMLRAAGIAVYLDDFGEGAASLSMLRLAWSAVKLSRTICGAEQPGDVLQAVVSLAKARGMKVIAECVETDVHLRRLAAMGVDGFQGYFIHRPTPIRRDAADDKIAPLFPEIGVTE